MMNDSNKLSVNSLIFTTLWANSADNKLIFFPEKKRLIDFKQNLHEISKSYFWEKKDNLHEISKLIFLGKIRKKYLKMSSAEIFTQHAKHSNKK